MISCSNCCSAGCTGGHCKTTLWWTIASHIHGDGRSRIFVPTWLEPIGAALEDWANPRRRCAVCGSLLVLPWCGTKISLCSGPNLLIDWVAWFSISRTDRAKAPPCRGLASVHVAQRRVPCVCKADGHQDDARDAPSRLRGPNRRHELVNLSIMYVTGFQQRNFDRSGARTSLLRVRLAVWQ